MIGLTLSLSFSLCALSADFHSPRTAALGGAGHAGPLLNDALYLNPSFIALLPTYSFSWNFAKFVSSENFYGRNLNASIQDGRTRLFQAGVGYTIREEGRFLHIGASRKIISRWGVGISWKLFFATDGNLQNFNDGTFSSSIIPIDWVQVSIIVENLLQGDAAQLNRNHREIILGTKFYVFDVVLLYLDPHYTPSITNGKFGWEVGAEFTMFKDIFLRVGAFKNAMVPHMAVRGRGFASGIGWVGPRLSIDYGLKRTLEADLNLPSNTTHTVGFTAFF